MGVGQIPTLKSVLRLFNPASIQHILVTEGQKEQEVITMERADRIQLFFIGGTVAYLLLAFVIH